MSTISLMHLSALLPSGNSVLQRSAMFSWNQCFPLFMPSPVNINASMLPSYSRLHKRYFHLPGALNALKVHSFSSNPFSGGSPQMPQHDASPQPLDE